MPRARPVRRGGRLRHRAGGQPDVRRADRPVVRRGLAFEMGSPAPVRLIELGPGRGTLMADFLRAARGVDRALPMRWTCIWSRPAPACATSRRNAWGGRPPRGTTRWTPSRPARRSSSQTSFSTPCRSASSWTEAGWCERPSPADADGGLRFAVAPGAVAAGRALPPGCPRRRAGRRVAELCPAGHAMIGRLARRLVAEGGAAPDRRLRPRPSAAGDTLQAVRAHAYAPVLDAPGQADLTAHVDFAQLAAAARDSGVRVWPPLTQSAFLQALGIGVRARQLSKMQRLPRHATSPPAAGTLDRAGANGHLVQGPGAVVASTLDPCRDDPPEPAWPNT